MVLGGNGILCVCFEGTAGVTIFSFLIWNRTGVHLQVWWMGLSEMRSVSLG